MSKTVLEVCISTRRYRSGLHILGIQMGKWQELPPQAERVVIRYYSEYHISGTDNGGEEAYPHAEYIVLLSQPNTTAGFIIYRDSNYARAQDIAWQLGDVMDLEVIEFDRYKQKQTLRQAQELTA